MRLSVPGSPHLTYCTNIHPGETWREVRQNVEQHVLEVKRQVSPTAPFGVGLRLSAVAADELGHDRELDAFASFLAESGLYVFTMNGFPYGAFHGTRVKENVYRPDWLEPTRRTYTGRLAEILARLLPNEPGMVGTISTVPGAFKPRVRGDGDVDAMAQQLRLQALDLHRLQQRTGKCISVALEAEPSCFLETLNETVAFFLEHLFSRTSIQAAATLGGVSLSEAELLLRDHLGVCVDTCHMAVEFEDGARTRSTFAREGIRIDKVQLSAGIEVNVPPGSVDGTRGMRAFAEDTYLHQVVESVNGAFERYVDLPEALAAFDRDRSASRRFRVHFHVPIFQQHLGEFSTTQLDLSDWIDAARTAHVTNHFEIETYTWDVLPPELRRGHVCDAIAREMSWALQRFAAGG